MSYPTSNPPRVKELMEFYDVTTWLELIEAQAKHIEKLQEKLREAAPYRDPFQRTPREG